MITLEGSKVEIRPAKPSETERLGHIWHAAFSGITDLHGFPRDFASCEEVTEIWQHIMELPHAHSFVAERLNEVLGGATLWESESVAGIGPVFVRPDLQREGIGCKLMEAALDRAEVLELESVRLTQAAFNLVSLSLYAKLGFQVKEPLVVMTDPPLGKGPEGYVVRAADASDLDAMDELCFSVHRHSRRAELAAAIDHETAKVVIRGGSLMGYATDLGFMGHAVSLVNEGLYALIASTESFSLSGIMIPTRNAELFQWSLDNGMRARSPWNLMVRGWYHEPVGAFLPSALY